MFESFYNDSYMIPVYVAMVILYFFILMIAIAVHELGHILYLKVFLKKKLKYTWIKGSLETYIIGLEIEPIEGMTDKQHKTALWVGLIFGMIPIIITTFKFGPAILLAVPYLYIMKYDLKEAIKGIKIDDELEAK